MWTLVCLPGSAEYAVAVREVQPSVQHSNTNGLHTALFTLLLRHVVAAVRLQEEVAQRLVDATPGRPDYRAMNIITHYYSKPVYRFL